MTACADTLMVELHYGQWLNIPALWVGTEHADVVLVNGGRVKALGGNDFIVDADSMWAEFDVALRVAEGPIEYGDGGGNGRFSSGGGDDVIIAGDGHDTVFAGTGDDLALGDAVEMTDAAGEDRTSTRQVRETRAGNDKLYGGPGNDIIHGGAGLDRWAVWGWGRAGEVRRPEEVGGPVVGKPLDDAVEGGQSHIAACFQSFAKFAVAVVMYDGDREADWARRSIRFVIFMESIRALYVKNP